MKKDYLIEISGKYLSGGVVDRIEMTTLGSLARQHKSYYLTYRESESSGMEGVVTTLKIEGKNKLTLLRRGASNSRLILEKGKRHMCHYDTGFGEFLVGVFAKNVDLDMTSDGGDLHFQYTLDINSDLTTINDVHIKIKEAETCPQ